MTDHDLAAMLALEAGRILMDLRAQAGQNPAEIGKHGDFQANEFLVRSIREHRPDDGLLSEEEKDNEARLMKSQVWIIDPVDGTREYAEGRADWAVHVALAVDGEASIGAVALPALDLLLRSDEPLAPPPAATLPRMVVSRTRPAKEALAVAEKIGAELVPMGSAGAKAMAVVRGEAEIYLHSGGQYEWDSCAPVAVAIANGLHVSRLDGSALRYNNANVYMPDLLICRPEWTERIFASLPEIA